MKFLVTLMFRRLHKSEEFIFGVGWGWGYIRRIWRGACIQDLKCVAYFFWRGLTYGGLLTEFYGISSRYFLEQLSMASSDYTHVMIWGGTERVFFF